MNYFSFLTLLSLSFLCDYTLAQVSETDIVIGKSYTVSSNWLKENVTVQVALPKDYKITGDGYPVLYLMDGQWFFPHGVSARSDYTERNGSKFTPDFIIIGIITDNSKRWEWSVEKTFQFLDFMEKELIPFIDNKYHTTQERLLFGWETTGGFVLKALGQKPDLFEGYLMASPAPLYGSYFPNLEQEYKELEKFFTSINTLDKFLFIAEGETDYPVQYGTSALVDLLQDKAPPTLRWHYIKLIGVSHEMSAYETIRQGLQLYYQYYHFLTYTSIAEFNKRGGLKYMESFYKERAKKLRIEDDSQAQHATRRNLTLVAISENNYEMFDSLYQKFRSDSLLEKSFPAHINAYAQFYLENNKTDVALEIANFLITKNPEDALSFNTLGDIYKTLNKKTEAGKNYSKAVEIATKNEDWRLSQYQMDLKQLNQE